MQAWIRAVTAVVTLLPGASLSTAETPAPTPPPAAAEPAPELHRGADYPGAAAFMRLDSATVVYPTRSAVDPVVAKASATARGRWLESVFHMRVEVVADDAITESQRRGNLLLLGWGNRCWERAGLSRPFAHTQDGVSFLGIEEHDPDDDLLVFHRNPLDWSSFILFWSRIDPERDRLQVVPRLGSDWAIYRDYYPVRQGMFKPARVWPPERDPVAEARPTLPGPAKPARAGYLTSDHYRMVFDKTTLGESEAQAILKARETALGKASAALGLLPQGFLISLNVYVDEDDKRVHSGMGDPTHALPWSREIDMVQRYARSTSPHEEAHIVAGALFGPCYLTAVCEGLAIAVENSWRGKDLDTTAAMLRAAGALPAIGTLLDQERLRALPEEAGFGSSGVLVAWLRSEYGPASVAKFYGLREGTTAALAASLAVKEADLDAAWTRWADARVAGHSSDLDFAATQADAKTSMTAGDWPAMAAALKRALAARPNDPQTAFNLASAQMRTGDLAAAAATLQALLASELPSAEVRFKVFGHYQLGRVYDLLGRRQDALREYDRVLALPDDHGAHALALERKTTPATKDDLD